MNLNPVDLENFKVVLLPYFCCDNFIKVDDLFNFFDRVKKVYDNGGGNLKWHQSFTKGGKAVNCAYALCKLGVYTIPIVLTNDLGFFILKSIFKNEKVNLNFVKTDWDFAITTVIETDRANVMINSFGKNLFFDGSGLTSDDFEIMNAANAVVISDWALNEKGNELLRHVFSCLNENVLKVFDPGDFNIVSEDKIKKLKKIIEQGIIDVISLNEYELLKLTGESSLQRAGELLSEYIKFVDVHTAKFSLSFNSGKLIGEAKTYKVKPLHLTGAGDTWLAGNIVGYLLNMEPENRLRFANAVAALYISNPEKIPPDLNKTINFITSHKS